MENDIKVIEASQEAEDAWVQTILDCAQINRMDFLESCTPGYYNNEGKPARTERRRTASTAAARSPSSGSSKRGGPKEASQGSN